MTTIADSSSAFDEISCGGVPFYLKKDEEPLYLLVLHNGPYPYWAFPKGRQIEGESYEQTAIREIREETGQSQFQIVKRLISDSIYFPQRGKKTIVKKVVFFLVHFSSKKVVLSAEHSDLHWATYDEAQALLKFDGYLRVLNESHEFLMNQKKHLKDSQPKSR
ncbi:MAG: NUDIX domain-containing protein [Candidatus Heimdallarchaeota archaeon]